MGQTGSFSSFEMLNPNVTINKKLVFDVPQKQYKLQVLVPYQARLSYGGYQKVTGRSFYFDLSMVEHIISVEQQRLYEKGNFINSSYSYNI